MPVRKIEFVRLGDWLDATTRRFVQAGVDSPRLSAEVLAREVLGGGDTGSRWGSARLFGLMEAGRVLTPEERSRLEALAAERATGRPVAQLVGHREFFGRDFLVTPHTLIPRPETELLVERALSLSEEPLLFVDVGSGTGCLGLTLAAERPAWRGVLLDASWEALTTAADNCARLCLGNRVQILGGDMFCPPLRNGVLDLVVSNPPYIAWSEREEVMNEVLAFEPGEALFSENGGLCHLESVSRMAARILRPGGWLMLEHGAGQGNAVRRFLAEAGAYESVETLCDLAGLERCTCAQKKKTPDIS